MIITISHQKGGVGKSTIAFNLAVELGKKFGEKQVKIIDLDVQKSLTQANLIRKNNKLTPLNIIEGKDENEIISVMENFPQKEILIIDSGGFDSSLNRIAIVGADIILTPVTDKTFDLLGLQRYEEILKELSEIEKRTIKSYVFLNNINPNVKKMEELIRFINSSKHFEILKTVIRTRIDFSNSIAEGKSVTEYKKESKAAKEIQNFIKEIINL